MKSLIFIAVSAFLFNYIIPFGDALQCYRCDMEIGNDCDNPVGNKALITDCSIELNEKTCFVRKTEMSDNNGKNKVSKIQRGCGSNDPCFVNSTGVINGNINVICTKCRRDLCNSETHNSETHNSETKNTGYSNLRVNFASVLLSSFMYFCIKHLL